MLLDIAHVNKSLYLKLPLRGRLAELHFFVLLTNGNKPKVNHFELKNPQRVPVLSGTAKFLPKTVFRFSQFFVQSKLNYKYFYLLSAPITSSINSLMYVYQFQWSGLKLKRNPLLFNILFGTKENLCAIRKWQWMTKVFMFSSHNFFYCLLNQFQQIYGFQPSYQNQYLQKKF
ncbi:Hypothetical_protein [Hexamita inflata]|uniref:Hypothetical_protein n=1 Tax=Hexamita inflata TaxID=28002 RepID=A0ABP1JEI3_9EUKA